MQEPRVYKGFNPLTRIRSSLTKSRIVESKAKVKAFQSPHEDSFFSDARTWTLNSPTTTLIPFQSPHEDSFFSDLEKWLVRRMRIGVVFQSPHEDSFFSDESARFDAEADMDAFQSPHEDSFFSDALEDARADAEADMGFNPLTRIRSSLTNSEMNERKPTVLVGFNPLTRIRSSLTQV